jgi:hypothetical protein
MKLYVILTRKQIGTNECDVLFEAACQARGLEYVRLIADDIGLDDIKDMPLNEGSLLYRMGTTAKARTIESMLNLFHPGKFTTIYEAPQPRSWGQPLSETAAQMAAGLTVIPTLFVDETWRELSNEELVTKTGKVGGFPLIVKTLGKSHGQGVRKADSTEELQELLADSNLEEHSTIVRRYLADYRHYRLIVVDDAVRANIEYHKPENDFRTNAATPVVTAVKAEDVPGAVGDLAIAATRLRGSMVAGVDILVDKSDGVGYLAEVNVPCYFARAEAPTGADIAGGIIEAMQRKQAKELT